jgi:tetratricopeptide (TPR) repeat protein
MGVVYKARQISLDRVVVLKMLVAGSHAGPEQLSRFRAEAEMVARLQHPHIVQIYEVGESEGRPFFAMEYVEGNNLAQHLGGVPQPARQSAELVQCLARAVHFAHQRGILHRDLKPGNILLEERRAGEGRAGGVNPLVPHITDFGLAKRLAGAPATGPGHQTKTGDVMGTPSYMAPEQAGGMAKHIGPAADVYALGAILYEMLTGRPPFLAENPVETVLQVLRDDPVPPRSLQPKVPRDLETITLHCLEKAPRKRYQSAEALAEDLQRYLAGQPIRARPIGAPERLLKWAKRRPAVAALLGVSLLALLVVCAGVIKLQVSRHELQAVNLELRDSNEQLTVALGKEEYQRQRNVMQLRVVQQTLGEYAQTIDEELDPLPQTEQVRRELLGTRLRLLQPFLDLEPSDPELRRMKGQAALEVGVTLQRLGRLQDADKSYSLALELFDGLLSEFPDNSNYQHARAEIDIQRGTLLQVKSEDGVADKLLRQAVGRLEKLVADFPEPAHQQTLAIAYHNLALLLIKKRRFPEARAAHEAVVTLREKLVRAEPGNDQYKWALAGSYNNLGSLYLKTGQPAKAGQAFEKVQRLLQQVAPRLSTRVDYRRLLAGTHLNLGILLQGHDPTRATEAYRQALLLWTRLKTDFPTVPEYRRKTADVHFNLGLLCWLTNQVPKAEASLQEALRLQDGLAKEFPDLPAHQSDLVSTLYYLGRIHSETGRAAEAEGFWRRGLEVVRVLIRLSPENPEPHRLLGNLLGQLADLRRARGNCILAMPSVGLAAYPPSWIWIVQKRATRLLSEEQWAAAARDYREGMGHLRLARKADPMNVRYCVDLESLSRSLAVLADQLGRHADLAEAVEALVEASEGQTQAGAEPAQRQRQAAGAMMRCLALARADSSLGAEERVACVKSYSTRAVHYLRVAVQKGYRNRQDFEQSLELAPLRSRADFQEVLTDLKKKVKR